MNRPITRTALAVTTFAILTVGCGDVVERATEEAVERAVEEAAESDSGGNVDVEFNEDGISVESDEGDFTLSVDDDGVEFEGTDAEGNDFSLDADEDGTFTATDADGEITSGEISSDGDSIDFTVEGEDGDAVFSSGEGIPDEWPGDIPEPEGLDEIAGTYIADSGEESLLVTGVTGDSAQDAFDAYVDRLTDAGFEEQSAMNQGSEFYSASFTRGDTTVSVTTQSDGGSTTIVIAVN